MILMINEILAFAATVIMGLIVYAQYLYKQLRKKDKEAEEMQALAIKSAAELTFYRESERKQNKLKRQQQKEAQDVIQQDHLKNRADFSGSWVGGVYNTSHIAERGRAIDDAGTSTVSID
jgi:hydroxylamine reductase (hybrid-cluster protein)